MHRQVHGTEQQTPACCAGEFCRLVGAAEEPGPEGQVYVGAALTGALNPPSSGPVNNPPYVLAFYGNQATDADVDAGEVLYVLFQFTEHDASLQCNIVIAGYLIDK
jgi:hypothetical protein